MTLGRFMQLASAVLLPFVAAQVGNACCEFTLSSPDSFSDRAGQLVNGQIRFHGYYPTSTFCIDKDGGITDQSGFGCIVTDAPETQIQCDHGKAPVPGFSINKTDTLMYMGSSEFYACPATDWEYNIYVAPDFGQEKCFPITLKTNGCGVATNSSAGNDHGMRRTRHISF